jgi:hypothetical protein
MSTPPDSLDSLEARLARVAQSLDGAAEQYAHKRSPSTVAAGSPRATRIRRMTGIASIAGIAAAVLLVGSIVRDQRRKDDAGVVAMSGVGANPSTFPFVGQLTIPVENHGTPSQMYTFIDGTAKVDATERITIESAIDVDIDQDGIQELALLMQRWADTPEQAAPSDAPYGSTVAIYKRVGSSLKLHTSMEGSVDRIDGLGTRSGGLVIARQVEGKPTVAAISESIIRDAVLDWAAPNRTLTVSELSTLDKSPREIRFRLRTTSGLIIADLGKRAGWFRAEAGQMLHIDATSVPTGTTRTVTIRRRGAPAEDAPLATAALPGPMQFSLPTDDEYEVLVGEGDSRVTFELAIDQPGTVSTVTTALYAPTVPASVPLAEIPTPSIVSGASTISSPDSLADSSVG